MVVPSRGIEDLLFPLFKPASLFRFPVPSETKSSPWHGSVGADQSKHEVPQQTLLVSLGDS